MNRPDCYLSDFPPFFDRAQVANRNIPVMIPGIWIDIDNEMQRMQEYTRIKGGCRTYEVPDILNFNYLPYQIQQPDTRPWTNLVYERQCAKDLTRIDPTDYLGNTRPEFTYPKEYDCNIDHSTNTVYKTI